MTVEFEENENFKRPNFNTPKSGSKIGQWLVSKNIAKNDAEANKIQLIVAVFLIIVALILIF